MAKTTKVYLPILIMQDKRIGSHLFPIIISIPLVECMGPVLYLQCWMPVTSFSECRIIWLWISKPTDKTHHSKCYRKHESIQHHYTDFPLLYFPPKQGEFTILQFHLLCSKTFLISSISNSYVNWCKFVCYRITVTSGYIVVNIWYSILKFTRGRKALVSFM